MSDDALHQRHDAEFRNAGQDRIDGLGPEPRVFFVEGIEPVAPHSVVAVPRGHAHPVRFIGEQPLEREERRVRRFEERGDPIFEDIERRGALIACRKLANTRECRNNGPYDQVLFLGRKIGRKNVEQNWPAWRSLC